MATKRRHRIPIRIPFFRIFYSTTYTVLFLICLVLLAITPGSLIFTSIKNSAYQYILMVGGVYILTAIIAIFVYASRLYTNRSVLAAVGKPYIPIEEGEIGKGIRKMIVRQMERSAIIAWESRPRDLMGEILQAEQEGLLETTTAIRDEITVGTLIPVDPEHPPWGTVQHPGWSSPTQTESNKHPHVQFSNVVNELPNLVEARAVSLAPLHHEAHDSDEAAADPAVLELLRRPETMGLRDYLTQLSFLGVFRQPDLVAKFLELYESARFSGRPVAERSFAKLMNTFSLLLAGMTELDPAIIEQIHLQTEEKESDAASTTFFHTPDHRPRSIASSNNHSPVTARTRISRNTTPYLNHETPSEESFGSVIHRSVRDVTPTPSQERSRGLETPSMTSLPSDAGSVVRHPPMQDMG